MVNTVDTIVILYNRKRKDVSGYLAEFFELCGFFVIEETEGTDTVSVRESQKDRIVKVDAKGYTDAASLLSDAINHFFGNDPLMVKLSKVYSEQNLFVHCMMEKFYYGPTEHIPMETRIKSSYDAFKRASEQLDKEKLSTGGGNPECSGDCARYYEYFKTFCKSKMNNLCDMMETSKDFSTKSLILAALQLTDDYVWFYQGQVLAGLIADKDVKYAAVSREFYSAAMGPASEMFKGYLHYRLAHYYEKTDRVYEKALRECENALEILPENIRIVYKKGILKYRLGLIGAACRDFMHVCDLLSDAVKTNCLEPIELEYLYGSYAMLHIIYSLWLKEKGNAEIVAKWIEGIEHIIDADEFFPAVFGENAQTERELLKEYMRENHGNTRN